MTTAIDLATRPEAALSGDFSAAPATPSAPERTTTFLSPADIVQLIERRGIGPVIGGIADCIRNDFCRWPQFDKSARVGCHAAEGVIELMPIADADAFSFKYVNGHPGNPAIGLSTVMGFGVLADMHTGRPLLLSDLTLVTALRTAAMSVLAARTLAKPQARTMALIGNGAQSTFQALGFVRVLGIRTLRLHDVDPTATAALCRHLDREGIDWIACASAAEAVRGADIVTTVTAHKGHASIVTADMIEPGMHLNAVGGDCPGKTEIDPAALRLADVFVEYEPQTRIEGDIQRLPADSPVTELWRVLTGAAPGRRSRDQVTMFDSVGFALEDFSALRYLRDAARDLQLGQPIELVAAPRDPKDLYALVADGH